jgi:hypothetical protein
MPARSYDLHGVRVFECAAEGARLGNDGDAVELIGTAWQERAALIALPMERLGDDFFRLRTRRRHLQSAAYCRRGGEIRLAASSRFVSLGLSRESG